MPGKAVGGREKFENFKRRKDGRYVQLLMRNDFAQLIAEGLRAKGMTQRELADATGTQEAFISRLIHGESNLQLSTIAKILQPLGIVPTIIDEAEYSRLRTVEQSRRTQAEPPVTPRTDIHEAIFGKAATTGNGGGVFGAEKRTHGEEIRIAYKAFTPAAKYSVIVGRYAGENLLRTKGRSADVSLRQRGNRQARRRTFDPLVAVPAHSGQ
jgi:transcriptional regulator with XRE-family HTH domain